MGKPQIIDRIRRTDQPPKQIQDELDHGHGRKYPNRVNLPHGYELQYRRSQRYRFYYNDDDESRYRTLFGWIKFDGRRVGGIEMTEFEIDQFESGYFINLMDCLSMETYALGEAVIDTWPEDDLFDMFACGSLIYFNTVWMSPEHARSGVWVPAANAMLGSFETYSLLLMKAFPLEYQGDNDATEGLNTKGAIAHRQAAMIRYYARHFGVKPLPNPLGRDGWLWAPHPKMADVSRESFSWLDPPVRKVLPSELQRRRNERKYKKQAALFAADFARWQKARLIDRSE